MLGPAGGREPGSVFRVQAHRAVLGPGVVEQRDLVYPGVEQCAPVLSEPALRVALAGEDRLLQLVGADHGAVRLLVPPGPGHRWVASLVAVLSEGSSGRLVMNADGPVTRRTRWPRRPCRGR